jgi:hypothetical protein
VCGRMLFIASLAFSIHCWSVAVGLSRRNFYQLTIMEKNVFIENMQRSKNYGHEPIKKIVEVCVSRVPVTSQISDEYLATTISKSKTL